MSERFEEQNSFKIVEYSNFDSAGTQSIIRETFIERNNNITTDTKLTATNKDSSIVETNNLYIDKTETDFKQQTENKTIVKSKQKQNYIIPIIIIMLIVAHAVYLIWRFYPRS